MVKLTFHRYSAQWYTEVCKSTRLVTALVLTFAGFNRFVDFLPDASLSSYNRSVDFLPDAKRWSGLDESAFADILSTAAWSHIST